MMRIRKAPSFVIPLLVVALAGSVAWGAEGVPLGDEELDRVFSEFSERDKKLDTVENNLIDVIDLGRDAAERRLGGSPSVRTPALTPLQRRQSIQRGVGRAVGGGF